MYFSNSVRAPVALHPASGILSLLNINVLTGLQWNPSMALFRIYLVTEDGGKDVSSVLLPPLLDFVLSVEF